MRACSPWRRCELLSFRYPVSEYLGAVDEENPFPKIRKRQTWVAAYRKNFNVHRLDLKRSGFRSVDRFGLRARRSATPSNRAASERSNF